MSRRAWWDTATTAARFVQVKNAAALGLTRREAAILLGTNRKTIHWFARYHGVDFIDARPIRMVEASEDDEQEAPDGVIPLDMQLAQSGAW